MKQKLLKLCSVLLTFAIVLSVCVFAVPSANAATAKHKDHIVNRGNGLRNTYAKLSKYEEVNVFYFGGSVTVGSGSTPGNSWRELTGKWLRENFPNAYVNNFNVAYGDTGSWFGLYRMIVEILPKNPDLIFIEFSINDFYDAKHYSPAEASRYFETIVRTIRKQVPDCDIVNVLTTEQSKIPNLISDDMLHSQAQAHEDIAAAYNVPTMRIGHALADHLYNEAGYGWQSIWKDYVGDIVHPTDKGYKVYFEVFEEYLNSELKSGKYDGTKVNHKVPECVNDILLDGDMQFIDADYDLNTASNALGGNFDWVSSGGYRGELAGGVQGSGKKAKFVIKFTGTELSVLYSVSSDFNGFTILVDGKYAFASAKKHVTVLVSGLKYGEHTVEITPLYSSGSGNSEGGTTNIFGFFTRNENKASHKHKYDNKCDKNCNVCGLTRITNHTYKTVTTKATTKKNGSIVSKCSGCGKTTGSKKTIYYAKKVKLSTTEYTYSSSKTRKPTVKVYDYKGNKISSSYYTVSYAKGCKKVGKYKVTIKFKGNYSGTLTAYFTIVPKESKVEKLTAAKKSLKVKISKVSSQASGYEIQYSTSSKFKSAKTKKVTSYKTTSVTLKSLKAKKTYYVRVRTYKTVDGKKYYSDWSSKKSKKTK